MPAGRPKGSKNKVKEPTEPVVEPVELAVSEYETDTDVEELPEPAPPTRKRQPKQPSDKKVHHVQQVQQVQQVQKLKKAPKTPRARERVVLMSESSSSSSGYVTVVRKKRPPPKRYREHDRNYDRGEEPTDTQKRPPPQEDIRPPELTPHQKAMHHLNSRSAAYSNLFSHLR